MVKSIAEIAVNVPLKKLFHYSVPEAMADRLRIGDRVLVPFGPRVTTGVCVAFPDEAQVEELKPIRDVLRADCRLDPHVLELTRWLAEYYHAGWGEVLEAAVPPPVKKGKPPRMVRWISSERSAGELAEEAENLGSKAAARARILSFVAEAPGPHRRSDLLQRLGCTSAALKPLVTAGWLKEEQLPAEPTAELDKEIAGLSSRTPPTLHADQERALQVIRDAVASGEFRPILLHGVTGSGKTEVYLRALREVIAAGKRGLVLVPEISLTPQTVLRFREGIDRDRVAVLHSMLGDAERARQWRAIQSGHSQLVIGPRSALFAPTPDLGLIIIDEEHEPSYKQESSPRYHARDVAVVRAHRLGIPIILGSATPSLESLHNVKRSKYTLVSMPERVTNQPLPDVQMVTLGKEFYRTDGGGLISPQLDVAIRQRLREREQTLLFMNRRGFATFVHCTRCDHVVKCADCDISMTFHRGENVLRCHYCGARSSIPETCPECTKPGLRRSGAGTEKIMSQLSSRYHEARVARLDRDTVTTHRAMREVIGRFANREYDILVGTQMVAKGHDFPGVTLVGIVNADTGLHFPDFRAAERTYQLITQVSGRAGRGDQAGRVIVQTFFPDHYAIRCAARSDDEGFVQKELEFRRTLGYPPFGRLAKVLFQGRDAERVHEAAAEAATIMRESGTGCRILGPVPSPIAKIQGKHRFQVLAKSPDYASIQAVLENLTAAFPSQRRGVERTIDVDPQSML